jgi:hypothetical protein
MRSYTIWSPEYSNFSGGIRALHVLNDELNKREVQSKLHYQSPHNPEDIVLYPEIITDNPLGSQYVSRWLLAEGQVQDLSFQWVNGLGADNNLTVNIIDLDIFYPRTNNKKGIGYWIGKGRKTCDLPEDAVLIHKFEPQDRLALAEQLASFEYIVSFDSFSAINFEALLVGTPVIIANQTGKWDEHNLRKTDWPLFGLTWECEFLDVAKSEVHNQFEAYKLLCDKFSKSIDGFIEITQKNYQ